jgi:hypothetical protein
VATEAAKFQPKDLTAFFARVSAELAQLRFIESCCELESNAPTSVEKRHVLGDGLFFHIFVPLGISMDGCCRCKSGRAI